jgi:hypothetical protein
MENRFGMQPSFRGVTHLPLAGSNLSENGSPEITHTMLQQEFPLSIDSL